MKEKIEEFQKGISWSEWSDKLYSLKMRLKRLKKHRSRKKRKRLYKQIKHEEYVLKNTSFKSIKRK